MDSQKKELQAKINDLTRLCEKHAAPKFTAFLTEGEQAELGENPALGYNAAYFGGYDGAARKIFGVFPEWQEAELEDFPIDIIRFTKKYPKELTHRDYMGTVLSLGIERRMIGDILVSGDGAFMFVSKSISGHITAQVEKIANCGVKTEIVKADEVKIPKQEFDDLFKVVASMRLDAVISAITNSSRSEALAIIKSSRVAVNHKEITDGAKVVAAGDTLSVRGFGRFVIFEEGKRTGSGKLHVHIKKYR